MCVCVCVCVHIGFGSDTSVPLSLGPVFLKRPWAFDSTGLPRLYWYCRVSPGTAVSLLVLRCLYWYRSVSTGTAVSLHAELTHRAGHALVSPQQPAPATHSSWPRHMHKRHISRGHLRPEGLHTSGAFTDRYPEDTHIHMRQTDSHKQRYRARVCVCMCLCACARARA